MPGRLSSGEREFESLVAQLRALEADIAAARQVAHRVPSGGGLHLHREPAPVLHGERVRLADGAEIVVRQIEAADVRELALGFEQMGALSRYRRFRGAIDHPMRKQLAELTDIDHESHEAIVAFDAATGALVGVARYVRAPAEPARADVSCMVLDPWQHRGVGSVLADRLAARARAAGIELCSATIVLGDDPARRLLAHVGEEVSETRDGGTVDITARARDR
jgi:GNAT superfamily N-acetyltransferase